MLIAVVRRRRVAAAFTSPYSAIRSRQREEARRKLRCKRLLRQRRGPKKAICAVAASMLTAIWHMLRHGTFYHDLGPDHFHRRSPAQQAEHLARQIARLGFTCTLTPQAEPVSV